MHNFKMILNVICNFYNNPVKNGKDNFFLAMFNCEFIDVYINLIRVEALLVYAKHGTTLNGLKHGNKLPCL